MTVIDPLHHYYADVNRETSPADNTGKTTEELTQLQKRILELEIELNKRKAASGIAGVLPKRTWQYDFNSESLF